MTTRAPIHRALMALTVGLALTASVLFSGPQANAQESETEVTTEYLALGNGLSGPSRSVQTAVLTDTDLIRGNSDDEAVRTTGGFAIFNGYFEFVQTGTGPDTIVRVERTGETLVTVTFSDNSTMSNVLALRDYSIFNYGSTLNRYLFDQNALGGRSIHDVTAVSIQENREHDLNWDDLGFAEPAPSGGTVLFSLVANQGGFADEDIVEFDPATGQTTVLFDGSDVGLGRTDTKAFAEMADGSFLITPNREVTVQGVTATRHDILRFAPTSLGTSTAGNFSLFLKGSEVGLTRNGERIDAIDVISENGDSVTLAISTVGGIRVAGIRGGDEDLTQLTVTSTGASSQGTWARFFDGSDLGLTDRSEDVRAAAVIDGEVLFTTFGAFSASGASGNAGDIVSCNGFSSGTNTSCANVSVGFNVSLAGLDGARIDGLDVRPIVIP